MADQIGDCKERVAYDLMHRISQIEQQAGSSVAINREYFLTLYRQCYKAIAGNYQLNEILDKTS